MKTVRVYACRSFDPTLQAWSKSKHKYTLDQIAGFAHAEPIMDEWEDVQRPTEEEMTRGMSSGIMQKVDPPPSTKQHLRLIVAGGRDYQDEATVFAVLDRIHRERIIAEIIHGDAPGADTLAGRWAKARGVTCTPCPADWKAHGKAAGPIRNRYMLTLTPDGVVLFPGGRGTADMRAAALHAGVKVWEPMRGTSR